MLQAPLSVPQQMQLVALLAQYVPLELVAPQLAQLQQMQGVPLVLQDPPTVPQQMRLHVQPAQSA